VSGRMHERGSGTISTIGLSTKVRSVMDGTKLQAKFRGLLEA
jgi:hypothetical protein